MSIVFTVLILLCAREDSARQSIHLVTLILLLLAATLHMLGTVPSWRDRVLEGLAALALSTPFLCAARSERGGLADGIGIVAIALRFGALHAPAVISLACLVGLLQTAHARGGRIPFFPALAAASLLSGGWQ